MDETFRAQMVHDSEQAGFHFSDRQIEQFGQFYLDLIETNKVMNLTAITEMHEVISKHFLDSLQIVRAVPDIAERPYSVIDVGTGAGFPGIPMAIAWPELRLFLLDSLNKRILFIRSEADKLGLSHVTADHGRAEDFGRNPAYREKFDLCVSRAVANLSTLSEYCTPFIHKNGRFIPFKSGNVDEELLSAGHALMRLGCTVRNTVRFSLPGGSGDRSLILIEKTGATPKQFPRKAGVPQKEPLC
jgi:16S rRNA (guanine527-N7)-methyltransferase